MELATQAPARLPAFTRWLPGLFALALVALVGLPDVRGNAVLTWTFLGAAIGISAWLLALLRGGAELSAVWRPMAPHYVQTAVHSSIYAYWGWHWPQVYDQMELILAQVLFAYALDVLLAWTRGRTAVLGFGPIPIVFSTNLFLWFRDDWFFWQFGMIALAYLAKYYLRWQRDGASSHIFNPSSFPLAVAALILITTGTTNITWGEDIARHLGDPQHMYLWIFAVGLIVQGLFSTTLVTATAAVTLVLLNLIYTAATGGHYFLDSTIPIAVFLGMHLLITDPATSPRTELGKALFGAGYALSVFVLYAVLGWFGSPTFFDKLLAVPLLNLSVIAIDRVCRNPRLLAATPWRALPHFGPAQRNAVYLVLWILIFAALNRTGVIAKEHPGQEPAFWRTACEQDVRGACYSLLVMQREHCRGGTADACVDVARLAVELRDGTLPQEAGAGFSRACELGSVEGCRGLTALIIGKPSASDDERLEFLRRGFAEPPWAKRRATTVLPVLMRGCEVGDRVACLVLAELYRDGVAVEQAPERAEKFYARACEVGASEACAPRFVTD